MNPKADKGGKELLHLPQEFFPARKTQKAKTSKKHLHKLISAYSTSGSHWMACLTLVGLSQLQCCAREGQSRDNRGRRAWHRWTDLEVMSHLIPSSQMADRVAINP